tara:strand:+ start:6503 stop:7300 length:798 start_codon:yes stop_codon:yes gene_type:complete
MNIVVIGECCKDIYIYGSCNRLCPEGPVPIFIPERKQEYSGMAGNTYENLKQMCSDDDDVDLVCQFDTYHFAMTKTRYVDETSNQLLLRIDEGDETHPFTERRKEDIISKFCGFKKEKADLLIVSDYCKGFLSEQDLLDISVIAEISILDTKKKLSQRVINSFNFVKMNETEFNKNKNIFETLSNQMRAIVTKGSKGVFHMGIEYPPPKIHQTFDVSGAGDVFTAGFGYNLASGKSVKDSITAAQQYCSKVIQKRGTCVYEKNMD